MKGWMNTVAASSRARIAVCAASALVFLGLTLASVVRTSEHTAILWHGERVRWEVYGPWAQGLVAATYATPMDPRLFAAWRAALRPGDTYAFVVGAPHGERTVGRSVEMYARFYLLPNVEVARPREADVVLAIARDPRTLGLRFSEFWTIGKGIYAGRLRHG
jgi:hypothetical protein